MSLFSDDASKGSNRPKMEAVSPRLPLTEVAAMAWPRWVRPGDRVLDATAGNGHDTSRLAELVGPDGHVFAFDIQAMALKKTHSALQAIGVAERVTLIQASHSHLLEHLPASAIGQLSLVCFNLGYLPGGDHTLKTETVTTVAALNAATKALSPKGALSVMTYRGHPGAMEEHDAVEAFFRDGHRPWNIHLWQSSGGKRPGPVLRIATLG
jgi:predicted methyltransferase